MPREIFIFIIAGAFWLVCSGVDNSAVEESDFDTASLTYLKGEADAAAVMKSVAEKKGNVVLLNMWATWCAPCVEEFPDIVKLYDKYKDRGLDVITVSHDYDASFADSFLVEQKAGFTNFLLDIEQDSHYFIVGIDEEWYGGLPSTWLFDRNGERRFFVEGMFNTKELEKKIVELLKK